MSVADTVSTNQFKIGMTILLDNVIYQIVDFQHVKPGKGQAFVRSRIRNLKSEAVLDRTFRAGEKVEVAHLDRRNMQFLYRDGDNYVFMDAETFDQIPLSPELVGDSGKYFKEGQTAEILHHLDRPIGIEPPIFVELMIAKTVPGVRGDTTSGGSKPATLETGVVVQVPLFVEEGDMIRVDTRSGDYVTRI